MYVLHKVSTRTRNEKKLTKQLIFPRYEMNKLLQTRSSLELALNIN